MDTTTTTTNASADELARAREPSGPPPVTLWQVLRGPRADPLVRWTHMRETYGDVVRYRYVGIDTYFITSADGARRVLQENAANYNKENATYRMMRRLFGNGLLTSDGSLWLRQRRLAQPAFHKERIAKMGERMTVAAADTVARWRQAAATGQPVAMAREMSRVTLRVVGEALFGTELAARTEAVGAAWNVLSHQLAERRARRRFLPPILPTRYDRAFRHARRTLFDVVDGIIGERRARPGGDDLLAMFMEARDEETGATMSDAQLRDEVVTMLLAGHETTAVALTWAWALLDVHRDVAARLHEELAAVLGGRAATPADYPSLRYTRAVINEALRLHPPAYLVNRQSIGDDVVCGFRVRGGASIVISPVVLHRHPAYWERADEFVPERWLDVEAEKRRPRCAFIPFSAGPRQCIGNSFSLLESALVLATVAQHFAPRLVTPGMPAAEYHVLARPVGDVPMQLEASVERQVA